jgi:YVTN family beta-propeller protein
VFRLAAKAGVVILLLGVPGAATAGDHYLGYRAAPNTKLGGVKFSTSISESLEDQFRTTTCNVVRERALYTPATTDAVIPENLAVHLVGYKIECPAFTKESHVAFDQFFPAGIPLTVLKPDSLLMPSGKSTDLTVTPPAPAIPGPVDAFLCYRASGPRITTPIHVAVSDQFLSQPLIVKKLSKLCSPVNKQGEDPSAPNHPGHLTCYRVAAPSRFLPKLVQSPVPGVRPTVKINNANFNSNVLKLTGIRELCIPAFKDTPPPTPTPTVTPDCAVQPCPDLRPGSVSLASGPGCIPPFSNFQPDAEVCVSNAGNAAAGPFHVEYGSADFPSGIQYVVDGLAAQSFDCQRRPLAPGSTHRVRVDVGNEVIESDELNNEATFPVAVPSYPPTCTIGPAPTATPTCASPPQCAANEVYVNDPAGCAICATVTPTATNTPSPPTPTPTATCAPTGTPYCSSQCPPPPTLAPGCFAPGGGPCIQNPQCAATEVCVWRGLPWSSTCCTCATVTPTRTTTPAGATSTPSPTPTIELPATGVFAYVTNGSGTVSVIDASTRRVVTTISLSGQPLDLAVTPDGARGFVTLPDQDSVVVIDAANFQIIGTVVVYRPRRIAVAPDGRTVYVSSGTYTGQPYALVAIDVASLAVVQSIPAGLGPFPTYPNDVAITPDGTFAFVTDLQANNISVIDLGLAQQTASIAAGEFGNIAITRDGRFAYVTNRSFIVDIYALDTLTLDGGVTASSGSLGIAFTPDGHFAYITSSIGYIAVINVDTRQLLAAIQVAAQETEGIAVTPDGAFAYAAGRSTNEVIVIDTASNTAIDRIAVGTAPSSLAFADRRPPLQCGDTACTPTPLPTARLTFTPLTCEGGIVCTPTPSSTATRTRTPTGLPSATPTRTHTPTSTPPP